MTGATSGIGLAAAQALAQQGAELTLLCRDPVRGAAVSEQLQRDGAAEVHVLLADMAELDQVRTAAAAFLDSDRPLHILLNNAGVINTERRETVDGYEQTFAVNHLAPFLLTGMLLPRLLQQRGSRVVNVASDAHHFCRGLDFTDLQSEQRYKTFEVYGRSKLANILFTRELACRLGTRDLTVNSLHPGAVASQMGTNNSGVLSRWLPLLLRPFFSTPEQGADTAVYLCTDAGLSGVSGRYFIKRKKVKPKPWALDDASAQQLWTHSEALTGFRYDL